MRRYDMEARRLYLSAGATIGVPLAWSLVTGGLVGVFVGTLVWAAGFGELMRWSTVAAALTAIIAWFAWLRWLASKWNELEANSPREPVARSQSRRIEMRSHEGRVTRIFEYRWSTRAQLMRLAEIISLGETINAATLERLYRSREAAVGARTEFIEKGLLRWRDIAAPKQGVILTAKGEAIFRALIKLPDTSSPPEEMSDN